MSDAKVRDRNSADHRSYRTIPMRRHLLAIAAAAALLLGPLALASAGAQDEAWISSWTASPQLPRDVIPGSLSNRTIRQIVHLSIGGSKVRVRLSNEFGAQPLTIGAGSVAIAAGADIVAGSLRTLTFGGSKSITIPPGAPVLSDPVELSAASLSDLAVMLYLPAAPDFPTVHQTGLQTGYVSAPGDFTTGREFPVADRFYLRFFLTGVMVESSVPAHAIAIFGDSISDGTRSTIDANDRWPDVLARRLQEAGIAAAVLNQGIAGNRILSDGAGDSALARYERDVLSQPGVSHVVIFLGINDIGRPGTFIEPGAIVRTPDELIAGYKQLIERAHARSIKAIGSPLTPFEHALAGTPNSGYFTPEKDAKRRAVNNWIRSSGAFDSIIDFEPVLADPAHPAAIAAPYDSGDHLHPNDAGYRAMGQSVDLRLFQ
jgi:lysophospholipase L1-like esterase